MYVTLLNQLTYAGVEYAPGQMVEIEDESAAWLIANGGAEETGGIVLPE